MSGRNYLNEVLLDAPQFLWLGWEPEGVTPHCVISGATGTISESGGVVTQGATGKINKAASFPGVDGCYVSFGNVAATKLTGSAFSIECWLKTPAATTLYQQVITKSNGTGADENYELRFNSTTGKLQFTSVFSGSGQTTITGDTVLSNNTWYHVVAIWTGSKLKLYVNAVEDATEVSTSGTTSDNTHAMAVGTRKVASGGQFGLSGLIECVALYGSALSASRIRAHYHDARRSIFDSLIR